ncbi:MAG: stage V sporulation protein AC [Defluviitaleaceae bacterium]|nr:stage V sporulation protein AC [Defluviitaleaceae bacterium]
MTKSDYTNLVKQYSPGSKIAQNCLRAFVVGGAICVVGQLIMNVLLAGGMVRDDASLLTACALIIIAIVLTAMGTYSKIGKFAGAGSAVPITGFANAITAPAIEYKKEGLVMGVGAKLFIVAGPVLVYGAMASVVVGIFYYLFGGGR